MKLLDSRGYFYPFSYPKAFEYYQNQQRSHWLVDEINLSGDISDWKEKLTDNERRVIGSILKGFTSAETLVGNYWASGPVRKFKHPEIQMMCQTNAAFEAIHADSYSKLNLTLGLDDFKSFNDEPTVRAKLDRLINTPAKTKKDIVISLAVFSAFTEGVNLFSSFAILLNFSRFNKMKGMGQIISLSIRDESLHSDAGCWLLKQFVAEYPEVWTDEVKAEIYEAARLTVELEDNFIDEAFKDGPIEGLDPKDLKQYIRFRCNTKLQDIGLKSNWKNIDKEAVDRITSWFDVLSNGVEHADFFALRVSSYSKSNKNWFSINFGDKK
jgi:ribonucleoside-diphosphate reductase beta chain